MPTTGNSQGEIILLNYSDSGMIVVTPEDEDRFVLTAQNAVKACHDRYREEEAIKSFKNKFLVPLSEWCRANAERIRACYVPVPVGHIQVFVIGKGKEFDFELGKDISQLELRLFDAGWRVNVLQIPHSDQEELQTYFNIAGAIQVHAQLAAASR